MEKKEEFKKFVKSKPELAEYVNKGEMSWQKFYEMYDLYGDDRSVWNKYNNVGNSINTGKTSNMNKLNDIMKGVNMDSIQEHIGTAQKALSFVQELTSKNVSNVVKDVSTKSPRPINKFFGD